MIRYDWQPGNGTRYDLLVGTIVEDGWETWVICWLRLNGSGGTCMAFPKDITITAGYLQEKMQVERGDALGLMRFMHYRGIDCYDPTGELDRLRALKPAKLGGELVDEFDKLLEMCD